MKKITNTQINLLISLVIFATLSRFATSPLLGHLPNFSALDATALCCGAYVTRRYIAISIVLFTAGFSDLFINKWLTGHWTFFYDGFYWQYISYMLITLLGTTLINNLKPLSIIITSLSATLLFFLVTNFGVWYQGLLYPQTVSGLLDCYISAIPFLKNSLFSDLIFTILLFGSMKLNIHHQNIKVIHNP